MQLQAQFSRMFRLPTSDSWLLKSNGFGQLLYVRGKSSSEDKQAFTDSWSICEQGHVNLVVLTTKKVTHDSHLEIGGSY